METKATISLGKNATLTIRITEEMKREYETCEGYVEGTGFPHKDCKECLCYIKGLDTCLAQYDEAREIIEQ